MNHVIELSPELYHILQRQAAVLNVTGLNATVESLVEAAVRRNYGQPSATGTNHPRQDQGMNGANGLALPAELTDELDQLAFFTDPELWQAAQTKLHAADHARMEMLLSKQQATGLDRNELAEAETLAERYEHTVLIRAKAAVLLKERGHDISSLGPASSLS